MDALVTRSFLVKVGGRLMRVTPYPEKFQSCDDMWTPVDCKDVRTRMESQAIVLTSATGSPETLIVEDGVRDALKSAYLNGTSLESGHYPTGGELLPDGFEVSLIG
jgi:hypothetical protein